MAGAIDFPAVRTADMAYVDEPIQRAVNTVKTIQRARVARKDVHRAGTTTPCAMPRGRYEKVRSQVPVKIRDRQRFSGPIRPSLTHEMPDTRWVRIKSRLPPRLRQMLTGQQVRGSRLVAAG